MRYLWLIGLLLLGTRSLAVDDHDAAALWVEGQALFYDFRDLESHSHRERIRILGQAEECIQQAHDRQASRQCEQAEQAARRQLRGELREDRQRLQGRREALFDRL